MRGLLVDAHHHIARLDNRIGGQPHSEFQFVSGLVGDRRRDNGAANVDLDVAGGGTFCHTDDLTFESVARAVVTGATGSQSIFSSSNLSPRPAAFAAPTDTVRASADASPSAAPPNLSCNNPDALGVARVVEIDTTGGPGFGSEHFKQHDFLRDKEVVLTFDDGPWPTTKAVLKALADECVRATFFAIGKHATYYPEILRSVAEAGHSVGSHTWSHEDLSKKSPEQARDEIEKAISAVQWALGDRAQEASFFRFPALRHPPEMVTYLGERNVAIFSTDMDSFDFKLRKPEKIVGSIMTKLQKHGKGIVLMHDFQTGTSHALALRLKPRSGGFPRWRPPQLADSSIGPSPSRPKIPRRIFAGALFLLEGGEVAATKNNAPVKAHWWPLDVAAVSISEPWIRFREPRRAGGQNCAGARLTF